MRTNRFSVALLCWLIVGVLAGCNGRADEPTPDASGSTGPTPNPTVASQDAVTLRLGSVDADDAPHSADVVTFANEVLVLSGGSLKIDVSWEAGGSATDAERVVAKSVKSGDYEMGWIGARAWDTQNVLTLQALQAPFLITDYAVFSEVLRSPISQQMLDGLDQVGLVGLGLFPDQLRHPAGFHRSLRSLHDFKGAAIRVPPSNASDALIRALGATPVHLNGDRLEAAINDLRLDGIDISMDLAPNFNAQFFTDNITWYPRVNSLFINSEAFTSLSGAHQQVLHTAAEHTLSQALNKLAAGDDRQTFCNGGGKIVSATADQVKDVERAAQPVYQKMNKDPKTREFITQIQQLKARTAPAPSPKPCN